MQLAKFSEICLNTHYLYMWLQLYIDISQLRVSISTKFYDCRRLIGRRINPDWHGMLRFIQGGSYTRLDQILVRLVCFWQWYHVWREKNGRRHHKGLQGTEQMVSLVNKTIKNRIFSLKFRAEHKLNDFLRIWFEVFD